MIMQNPPKVRAVNVQRHLFYFIMQVIRCQIQSFENSLLDQLSYESEVGDGTTVLYSGY